MALWEARSFNFYRGVSAASADCDPVGLGNYGDGGSFDGHKCIWLTPSFLRRIAAPLPGMPTFITVRCGLQFAVHSKSADRFGDGCRDDICHFSARSFAIFDRSYGSVLQWLLPLSGSG